MFKFTLNQSLKFYCFCLLCAGLAGGCTRKSEVAEIKPRNALLLYYRDIGYKTKEAYEKAKTDYEHMIAGSAQFTPKEKTADDFYSEGLYYESKQKYDEAIRSYGQGLALDPEDAGILNARANALGKLARFEEALEDATDAIRLNASSDHCLTRAYIWMQKGKYERAILDAKRAIKLNVENAAAYELLGFVLEKTDDFTQAIESYNKSHALNPGSDYTCLHRGICYMALGKENEAIADYKSALAINPKNYLVYWEIATLFEKEELLQSAIDAYRQYAENAPRTEADFIVRARNRIKALQTKNK